MEASGQLNFWPLYLWTYNWSRQWRRKFLCLPGNWTRRPASNIVTIQTKLSQLKPFIDTHSFIHSVFCLTTGPKPPPKRCLHIAWSRASSFKWEYPLLSLRSSNSFLRLLPRLLATSISPFIFPSITCFRRQFLRKMWPIQLAFRFLISCSSTP